MPRSQKRAHTGSWVSCKVASQQVFQRLLFDRCSRLASWVSCQFSFDCDACTAQPFPAPHVPNPGLRGEKYACEPPASVPVGTVLSTTAPLVPPSTGRPKLLNGPTLTQV